MLKLVCNSIDSTDMSLNKLQEIVKGREVWRAAVHGITKSQTGLNNDKDLVWTSVLQH